MFYKSICLFCVINIHSGTIFSDSTLIFNFNKKEQVIEKNYFFGYPAQNCELLVSNNNYFINFKLNEVDRKIHAIYDGVVILINNEKKSISIKYKDDKDVILIKYVGFKNINIKIGQKINKGDLLGIAEESTIACRIKLNDFIINHHSQGIVFENIKKEINLKI